MLNNVGFALNKILDMSLYLYYNIKKYEFLACYRILQHITVPLLFIIDKLFNWFVK